MDRSVKLKKKKKSRWFQLNLKKKKEIEKKEGEISDFEEKTRRDQWKLVNIAKLFVKVEETQAAKKKQFVFQWTTYLH